MQEIAECQSSSTIVSLARTTGIKFIWVHLGPITHFSLVQLNACRRPAALLCWCSPGRKKKLTFQDGGAEQEPSHHVRVVFRDSCRVVHRANDLVQGHCLQVAETYHDQLEQHCYRGSAKRMLGYSKASAGDEQSNIEFLDFMVNGCHFGAIGHKSKSAVHTRMDCEAMLVRVDRVLRGWSDSLMKIVRPCPPHTALMTCQRVTLTFSSAKVMRSDPTPTNAPLPGLRINSST